MKKNNLANIQELYYCDCKTGNKSSCASVATHQIRLCSKKDKSDFHNPQEWQHRCDKHKNKSTTNKRVFQVDELDQAWTLQTINKFLKSIIGKNIKSSFHTARMLEVKYLKDNGAVMCYQNMSKKWKYVYYHQIEEIINSPDFAKIEKG